ncbi:MAG: hypothetical protein K0R65_14 [Crocinitomicaceae bacterium]|jgi:hypothetical protein|nr:hypothetical protein [Crocinitomicaceae bacterium]
MYFPYFRGKRHEFYAILKANDAIYQKAIPIIEPVKLGSETLKNLRLICERNIKFILIINPTAQASPTQQEVLTTLVNGELTAHTNYILGFIIDKTTQRDHISSFVNMPSTLKKVFIHRGEYSEDLNDFQQFNNSILYNIYANQKVTAEYINNTSRGSEKVLIDDGFSKQQRNADYPEESQFSNLSLRYNDLGFFGFGDYLMVGDFYKYSEGGGGAYVMAIHILRSENNRVSMKHFLSDVNSTEIVNQEGKFFDALQELVDFVAVDNTIHRTSGIQKYLDLHEEGHFPGNGTNKEIAMIHHLEQITAIMN